MVGVPYKPLSHRVGFWEAAWPHSAAGPGHGTRDNLLTSQPPCGRVRASLPALPASSPAHWHVAPAWEICPQIIMGLWLLHSEGCANLS